ncbi:MULTISPECIES: PTS sugar transporter subunit IIA [unclassified Streptococcus]|uniref:PTS sugar transporter subunit IIA n=1 Tax=Streptococcus TaxID=1301 RepID=UPI0015553C60|nr:PTS fructose transporter subunit IIA [Streptococcus suis]NQG18695.1 PTS fructose transporter subunit IIA [Streptococcus suis]NQI34034.1 PTS fructose transporter subunit IIA [Streptococcus suis]NQL62152.1 PTS fructose transporter subunit IIA [Streptococcus suis]NQM38700.1 PTS fructose transporter subunit IIA [Streptococcus suis]NQP19341.1 PTS fructose transporter subunit IIA [Streptococcus suis]
MTKSLVLVSHGTFCQELKKSTEMIMGPQDNIFTVALLPEEGPEDFQKKFEETIADLDDFVVFADLLGGTPANVVSRKLIDGAQFDLYAGMNMPMVIGFLNGVLLGEDVDYVEFGSTNIQHINKLLTSSDDEDE